MSQASPIMRSGSAPFAPDRIASGSLSPIRSVAVRLRFSGALRFRFSPLLARLHIALTSKIVTVLDLQAHFPLSLWVPLVFRSALLSGSSEVLLPMARWRLDTVAGSVTWNCCVGAFGHDRDALPHPARDTPRRYFGLTTAKMRCAWQVIFGTALGCLSCPSAVFQACWPGDFRAFLGPVFGAFGGTIDPDFGTIAGAPRGLLRGSGHPFSGAPDPLFRGLACPWVYRTRYNFMPSLLTFMPPNHAAPGPFRGLARCLLRRRRLSHTGRIGRLFTPRLACSPPFSGAGFEVLAALRIPCSGGAPVVFLAAPDGFRGCLAVCPAVRSASFLAGLVVLAGRRWCPFLAAVWIPWTPFSPLESSVCSACFDIP